MTQVKTFRVLVASDGSPSAHAAAQTAMRFPWPEPSTASAVIAARRVADSSGLDFFEDVWRQSVEREREDMQRALAKRWPDADVSTPARPPIDAILGEARRARAGAIALGWRGHGLFKRLLLGSVSREIVRRAPCPVLVVREARRSVRRVLLGFDGSPQARRALNMLARAAPPRGGRIILVSVVEMLRVMTAVRLPRQVRATVHAQAEEENRKRMDTARRKLEGAAARLREAGWKVDPVLTGGMPLDALLSACDEHRADVMVLGARAKTGLERALLGSVANGALAYAQVPVLIVP